MRGLFREMVIAKRRRDDDHDARIHGAWFTEYFARTKTLPDFTRFFAKRHQTVSEKRSVLGQIAAAYNLKMVKRSRLKRKAA